MNELENSFFESAKQTLSIFGENAYIQALVAIVAFFILALVTDWVMTKGLSRLTRRTKSDLDDKFIALLHRPVFTTVVLLGLLIAVFLVSPTESVKKFSGNAIATLIIFLWLVFGIRATTLLITAAAADKARAAAIQPSTRPLFETAAKLILIALGIYFILISWGVDPLGWLATAGIAAMALGLAAQDTLGNLFSGISILADAPYKLGDFIVLEGQHLRKHLHDGDLSTKS